MLSLDRRPKSFYDFVGQKVTLAEMEKRAKQNDWPQVMFFVGPSGTGKTSLAYVVSSIMNDPNPILKNEKLYPNPESSQVRDIFEQKFRRDINFYDASTMGKDDVLSLQREVSSPAMYDKNKILIIDEAQELSKAGKGATLNLLEKINPEVKIILCTMEPDKFDKAILSRGQVYRFRVPTPTELAEHLYTITESILSDEEMENLPDTFFGEVLVSIAESAEGNVRTAMQFLERALNSKLYTEIEILEELGVVSNAALTDTVSSLLKSDVVSIEKIKAIGSKEFFYKSWKILIDAQSAILGMEIHPAWKAKFANLIKNKYPEETFQLLQLYSNVEGSSSFFQESIFLTNILLWIRGRKEIPILEKKPVRRKKVE